VLANLKGMPPLKSVKKAKKKKKKDDISPIKQDPDRRVLTKGSFSDKKPNKDSEKQKNTPSRKGS
jgi:hypothetical protein